MKTLVMNMSSGVIERGNAGEAEYGEEVLNAGWNPAVMLVQHASELKKNTMPAELATVDVELFLQMMYVCQR